MPKSHSKDNFGPPMGVVACSGCGRLYEEFIAVYLMALQAKDYTLLCIECDPEAEHALYSLSSKSDTESQ